jgi:hypothetical protein
LVFLELINNKKMTLITFIMFVAYATWAWRIMESYYDMPCGNIPCDEMPFENFTKNKDLEAGLHWE